MIFAVLPVVGCWAYCVLGMVAAMRHRCRRITPVSEGLPAVSVLKPLAGVDEGLEENLRSYFEQDYAHYEILFAVRHEADPAVIVVRKLMAEYPQLPARLLVTGEPPYAHAKVFSLQTMLDEAEFPVVAMGDSDVRVGPDFCRKMAEEFSNPTLGLVTCPYRAVGGTTIWSRLEALGMNTDFHAGLFTAVMMEGTKFAVGPTIVARRSVLDALGGMVRFKDYLAEDFMLGKIAAECGFAVELSPYIIEHRIGSEGLRSNFAHRLRWSRSTRRSRPAGYVGQFFTYPLPIALLAVLCFRKLWPMLIVTALLRAFHADIVSRRVLGAKVLWHLLPVQDLLAFAFWVAGFFGNHIRWRGRRYLLARDGTMQLAS